MNESTREARAELQAWYLYALQPKLARAAGTGVVDPRAAEALDAQVNALLGLSRALGQPADEFG